MFQGGIRESGLKTCKIGRLDDAPPSFFIDSTANPKVKTMEGEGVGAHSLAHDTLGVQGHARALKWD
jgi:hypothetical protein